MADLAARTWGRPRRERGATLVEFAIAFPVLMLLLLGIIDFGLNYSNKVQLGNAARAAARAGSVANVGTETTCTLTGLDTSDPGTKALMCSAKARTHADPTKVAVKIIYMGRHGKQTMSVPYNAENPYSLVVCMSVAAYSVTGMLGPIFDGHFQHSRSVIKTGNPNSFGGSFVPPGSEAPLSYGGATDNWNFCQADDPNGTE